MITSCNALRQLYNLIARSERYHLAAASGAAVMTVLSSTGLMAFSSYIISFAAMRPDVADILVAVTAVRFFGIARAVLRYTERITAHNTVFRLLSRLRVAIYQGVATMSGKQWLTLDRDLVFSTLTSDIETLQDFYLRTFMPASISFVIGLIGTLVIGFKHPVLATIFLLLYTTTHLGTAWLLLQRTRGESASLIDRTTQYRTLFTDYAEGQVEIQTSGRSQDYRTRLTVAANQLEVLGLRTALWRAITAQLQQLLVHATVLIALVTGILWVQNGRMSGIYLAGTALCCFTLYESAPGVLTLFQKLESASHSAGKLLHLARPNDPKALAPSPEASVSASSHLTSSLDPNRYLTLALENVSWQYIPESWALKNISLTLSRGQRVAVVGASGAGKSTMMGILTGLLPVENGLMRLNGKPLTPLDTALTELFAVVDQNVYLFNMTLRQNLLLGDPSASDTTLLEVLEQAGMSCTAENLDLPVGLSGTHFSGGQRQRIAIARALLRKAPFLLIDEAMAGLDEAKEKEVLRSLFENEHPRGILWITHRLIQMEAMDCIYVLDRGEIIEQGTHAELLSLGGCYAGMMAVQQDLC